MKILTCPMNGPRNINEFQSFGPLKVNPDPNTTSDGDWAVHLFRANNSRGVITEWWRREYNAFRPHSSLGYRPPAPEAVQWPAASMLAEGQMLETGLA